MATYAFGDTSTDTSASHIGAAGALLLAGIALATGVAFIAHAPEAGAPAAGAPGITGLVAAAPAVAGPAVASGVAVAPLVLHERAVGAVPREESSGQGPRADAADRSLAVAPSPLGSLQVRRALVEPLGSGWRIRLAGHGAVGLGVAGANPPARYAAVVDGEALLVGTVVDDPEFQLFLDAGPDRDRAVEIARSLTTAVEIRPAR